MRLITPELTVLENTHAITIILILGREGPMQKGILYQKISKNTASVQRRINDLVEAGLVTETETKEHPFPRIIDLTPLGREVAAKLARIEELVRRG